jgi:exo-1,4-beta-D-glucosaminidase
VKRHKDFFPALLTAGVIFAGTVCGSRNAQGQNSGNFIFLKDGWLLQSSAQVNAAGPAISSASFAPSGWHPATVPETVLSALVKDGTYTNIYFGTNLATIPTAPFTNAWWYRKEFDLTGSQAGGSADLIFEGINYRANLWLNGEPITAADRTFGAFRIFSFNVSGRLKPGKNVLAVEVFPPQPGDFTMGFVDWNPKPPDRDMGLFRPVILHLYQNVAIEHLFVESKINHDTWKSADLIVHADLVNRANQAVETTVKGEIGGISFSEKFTLQPNETRSIKLTPEAHPELKFDPANLWWPWELGEPCLYTLKMSAVAGGKTADHQETRFGIRETGDYLTADGYRGYVINGKKILIRGGGWADDLLLDEDPEKLETQIQYTRAMNLNTIRLEGIWGSSQRLYDLADEYGLLIMAGWSCQWEWDDNLGKKCDDFGGFKSGADMELATNYLADQVLWLRQHPSIFVWVLGSDMLPRPELEKRYDALLATIDPTRPALKSCSDKRSSVSGPTAVKMNGPYDYVTPNYWYLDAKNGGAFGFNTETGPGPQPPPLESLKRMFPAEKLWPVNDFWNFHSGRGKFNNINRYLSAFNHRYGEAKGAGEFAFKSQAANYEAIRPMYEAFSVNLPHTTGIIQWMLNPSWPKLYWQLYDYYLLPGGAFFGAKKGAAPVAVIYNYGDQGIYLVNQTRQPQSGWQTAITVYDANSQTILSTNVVTQRPVYGPKKIFDLSSLSPATPVYFVNLELHDAVGHGLADNFYWLSIKPDVLDEEKSEWFVTPNKSFADFTALNQLPEAQVQAETSFTASTNGMDAEVTLANTGNTLAFFIEMRIVGAKSQQTLLPVFWSDNYVSLPPGAKRTYQAHIPAVPGGEEPEPRLRGWNVKFETITKSN